MCLQLKSMQVTHPVLRGPAYAGTWEWPLREVFQHFPERRQGRKRCRRMPKLPYCSVLKARTATLKFPFQHCKHILRLHRSCNSVSQPKSLSIMFSQRYISDIESPLVCKPTLTCFALWSKICLWVQKEAKGMCAPLYLCKQMSTRCFSQAEFSALTSPWIFFLGYHC